MDCINTTLLQNINSHERDQHIKFQENGHVYYVKREMNKYFALIPARSGSIRIKNKNQSKIRNQSLLEWAIKYGIKQKELSQVFVSTDLNINLDF